MRKKAVGQQNNLNRFQRIVHVNVTMGVWVLVRADCAGEEFHAGYLFTTFDVQVSERSFFRCKRLSHERHPN